MTEAECKKLVAVLLGAFPQSRISQQTPAVYERMLADLDYPAANAAVERLLATARFMPTIAEIRETAMAISVGEQKPGGSAWGEVKHAIGRWGSYRSPGLDFTFEDPVTARCVAALGWQAICLSENETSDRARFIELYDRLAVQERRKQLSEGLPAMQRFRALQAADSEAKRIERAGATTTGSAISNVLALAMVPRESEDQS